MYYLLYLIYLLSYIDLTMPTHLEDDIATDDVRARHMFVHMVKTAGRLYLKQLTVT